MNPICTVEKFEFLLHLLKVNASRKGHLFRIPCTENGVIIQTTLGGKSKSIPSYQNYAHAIKITGIKEAHAEEVATSMASTTLYPLYSDKMTVTLLNMAFEIAKYGYKTAEGATLSSFVDLYRHADRLHEDVHKRAQRRVKLLDQTYLSWDRKDIDEQTKLTLWNVLYEYGPLEDKSDDEGVN